jgi:hypothetical protein
VRLAVWCCVFNGFPVSNTTNLAHVQAYGEEALKKREKTPRPKDHTVVAHGNGRMRRTAGDEAEKSKHLGGSALKNKGRERTLSHAARC